jgi:hypothetical protein
MRANRTESPDAHLSMSRYLTFALEETNQRIHLFTSR